jgi:hypothetical protein
MVFNIFFVALALSAVLLARLPRMGHERMAYQPRMV